MQSILAEHVGGWDCADLYVGCSGNFTVERALHGLGDWRFHGNDVTLYTSAIGAYLAGKPLALALNPEYEADYGWLAPYLGEPADTLATCLLSSRLVEGLDKDNAYYDRWRAAYRDQWPALHAKTVERVQACPLRLASYAAEDVATWLERVPAAAGVICYPPFYAGDYTAMYANLERLLLWEKPAYGELNDERRLALFRRIADRRWWLFGSHLPLPEYAPYLRGMTKTTNRGLPIYVYACGGPTRITSPRQEIEPVTTARLAPGQTIGDTMSLAILSTGQFQALRSQYMNENIIPGQATLAVGVLVDGYLVGVYAFSAAPTLVQWDSHIEGPTLYLLSDFSVAPTDYPRLSKLVLYAALSQESRLLAERTAHRRVRALVTTAFSKNPVSMKYRGLFDLLTRKENKGEGKGDDPGHRYYAQGYTLNYGQRLGDWTLAEGLAVWQRRHGGRK